jgi:hypothetical protein
LLGIALLTTAAFTRSTASKNPIQGVWKVTEVTTTGNNAVHIQNPQPGFFIFTEKYYSFVNEMGDKPRPDLLTPVASASGDELRDAWGPFDAQAGTYEIKGDEFTGRPLVAKAPANMKPRAFMTRSFKIEGNTLTFVNKATQYGPIANPNTVKLTRVE